MKGYWLRNVAAVAAVARQPALVRGTRTQPIRARYDNAQATDDNQRSWWMADYLSAKSANSFQVRRQLRLRSRYETSNNPYLFGICNSNADDLVGTGPTLQVATPDAGYNRRVEQAWKAWAAEVGLVEKLRTCKLARTVDGEGFLILKTVPDLEGPVKLYPCDVEADQVTTPAPLNLGELWVDGLVLHPATGRPTAYTVLRHHPGDYYFPDMNPLAVDRIAARHVVHWFPKFRPGQVRGVPVFTPALDMFNELRSYRKAVLAKCQVAANLTAVLQTKAPADISGIAADTVAANSATEPFDALNIDRGTMTTLPWDATLSQFAAPSDATTYEMFQEKCLGEACRPLNYPLGLALGTSQKFNFSSAKLDHINYREGLKVERSDCEATVLARLFAAWVAEAVLEGAIPPAPGAASRTAPPPHEWHWPGFSAIDPGADSQADIAQLNAGTLTYREFWAQRGYDWRTVLKQQSEEKKELEKLGLSFGTPPVAGAAANQQQGQDGGDGPGGGPPGGGKKPAPAEATINLNVQAYHPDQPRGPDGRWAEHGDREERHAEAAEHLRRLMDSPHTATQEHVRAAADALMRVSKAEAKRLAQAHGLKAKGTKQEQAEAIAADASRVVQDRERYARRARAAGLDEGHFFAVADEVHQHATEFNGQVKGMLGETRAAYKSENGKALTNLHPAFRGGDYTSIKGFERIARTMAGRYPELLGAHGYAGSGDSSEAARKLYDFLYAGAPKFTRADAYEEALRVTPPKQHRRGRKRAEEDVPFASGPAIRAAAAGAAGAAGDYLAAMLDALADGDAAAAAALRDLAIDAASESVEGLGGEGHDHSGARARVLASRAEYVRACVRREVEATASHDLRAAAGKWAEDGHVRDETGRFSDGVGEGQGKGEGDKGQEVKSGWAKVKDVARAAKETWTAAGKRAYAALPRPLRRAVDCGAWVEHKLESGYEAGRELAKATAKERGLSEEHVERVGRVLAVADGVSRWTGNIPVLHHVLEAAAGIGGPVGFVAAKLGYYVPVASLAYVGYSLARESLGGHPIRMITAARKLAAEKMRERAASHQQQPAAAALLEWCERTAILAAAGVEGRKAAAAALLEWYAGMPSDAHRDWADALLASATDAAGGEPGVALRLAQEMYAGEPDGFRASRVPGVRAAGDDSGGRWVTRDGGQHVWLGDGGDVHPGGPGTPPARRKGEPKAGGGGSGGGDKGGDADKPEVGREHAAKRQLERGQAPLPAGASPEDDEKAVDRALKWAKKKGLKPDVLPGQAKKAAEKGLSKEQFLDKFKGAGKKDKAVLGDYYDAEVAPKIEKAKQQQQQQQEGGKPKPGEQQQPKGGGKPQEPPVVRTAEMEHEEAVPDAARPPLSESSRKAIMGYTGGGPGVGYGIVNRALRDGTPLTEEQQGCVDGLKEAFAQTKPFDRPVQVKREMDVDQFRNPEGLARLLDACQQSMAEGSLAKLPGFTSTTSQDGWTFGGKGNVRMIIAARQGLDMKPASKHPDEDELLLDDGSLVRVTKMEKEIDPDGDPPPDERWIHTIYLDHVLEGEAKRDLKSCAGGGRISSASAPDAAAKRKQPNRFSEDVEPGKVHLFFVLLDDKEGDAR